MKRIYIPAVSSLLVLAVACNNSSQKTSTDKNPSVDTSTEVVVEESTTTERYDPNRGEGKFTKDNVIVDVKLDKKLAMQGEAAANVKCMSCHKLSNEKLVGPGWKGVTQRRSPYWIMNFISNPDPMLDKDPALQQQLELCLVRMPNQGLNDNEARQIYEFMRKNDDVQ